MCMYGNIIQMWISKKKMYSNLTKWLINIEIHIKQEYLTNKFHFTQSLMLLTNKNNAMISKFKSSNHQNWKCAKDKKWWYKVFNEKYEKFIHDTWTGLEHMQYMQPRKWKTFFCKEGLNELWL
jgi:hypothetical protein